MSCYRYPRHLKMNIGDTEYEGKNARELNIPYENVLQERIRYLGMALTRKRRRK